MEDAKAPAPAMDSEVDSAVETLMKAEEIKGNAELMTKVNEKLGKKESAIKSLAHLRKVAAKKLGEKK
jgi:hypothetical protein